mmetsp:Transcript_36116/g.64282  ORF Transcript_36116/g.64282 Transcript_36116/m.64282 type:complete len:123 (+) Transcript_36116:130-498(+)
MMALDGDISRSSSRSYSSGQGLKFCIDGEGYRNAHDENNVNLAQDLEGMRRRKKVAVADRVKAASRMLAIGQVTTIDGNGSSQNNPNSSSNVQASNGSFQASNASFNGIINPINGLPVKMSL